MKATNTAVMAAIAGMMLLFPAAPARADFISSVSLAGGIAQTSPGTFTLGYQFQVGALPYNVTAVGLWAGTPPSGEVVRIYENGTTTNTLVQSIMGSDPLSNDGTYRYVNLAVPVLLQANTVYNLVVDLLPGDQLLLFSTATSNDPNITYVQPIGDFGFGGGIFPTTDNVHLGPYLGATLQGEPAEQTPVPEPSSIPLFITGAGMICLACGWKRR